MTRHYYHESLDALRSAVAAIPVIGTREEGKGKRGEEGWDRINRIDRISGSGDGSSTPQSKLETPTSENSVNSVNYVSKKPSSIPARLHRLDRFFARNLITEEEFKAARARILAEL